MQSKKIIVTLWKKVILGTVYRSTGSWYKVVTQNEIINCRIQGRLRLNNIKSTNPVVVGDKVIIQKDRSSNKNEGVIVQIKERRNYIIRKSVNLSKQSHIIAANIDQAFLLITLKNPLTTISFIDRFLITAEAYKVKCILVFNKIDSYDKSLKIKINDGSDNIELFSINITSNAITSTASVTGTISETDPNALPLALALG